MARIETAFTRLPGIEHPIVTAPMSGIGGGRIWQELGLIHDIAKRINYELPIAKPTLPHLTPNRIRHGLPTTKVFERCIQPDKRSNTACCLHLPIQLKAQLIWLNGKWSDFRIVRAQLELK